MGRSIHIENLTFSYARRGEPVLSDFSLDLAAGEIVSLVGPSGSGKSSLLRLIAGLERPSAGKISVAETLFSTPRFCLPPEKRNLGMVSQSGDLFPHLTVAKNIAYGIPRLTRTQRQERVRELLDTISLPDIAKRYPNELSGGEAQRVALARALAPEPGILLLDEPFSSLDAELREQLRDLTAQILRQAGTTALFVTHHGEDALATGDRIIQLKKTTA